MRRESRWHRPLLVLREVFRKKGVTVREMTEALYYFLAGQEVEEKLSSMAQSFEQAGEYSLAKEYEQAYEQLLALFDRIVGLLGEEVLSVKTYNDVLDAGCREIRVGVIPAALDRVLVGDVERSRLKDIRALSLSESMTEMCLQGRQNGGFYRSLTGRR